MSGRSEPPGPGGAGPSEGAASRPTVSAGAGESRKPLADHPKLRMAVIVVGLLAGLATIAKFVTGWPDQAGGSGDSASDLGSPPAVSASPTVPTITNPTTIVASTVDNSAAPTSLPDNAGSSSGVSQITVGTCLTSDLSIVDCDAVHRSEVVAAGGSGCDVAAAVQYLAGDPSLDIVRAHLVEQSWGSSGEAYCVMSSANESDRSTSVEGLFKDVAGNSLRWCRDERIAPTDIGCDEPHTAEFVGGAAGQVLSQAQCETAASDYMQISIGQVSSRLRIAALQETNQAAGQARCIIAVRGNEVLTASVRNIRANALPLDSQ
jgi:hypothetical protein